MASYPSGVTEAHDEPIPRAFPPRRLGRAVYFVLTIGFLAIARVWTVDEDFLYNLGAMTLGVLVIVASVSRLHDVDRSGWWAALLFLPFLHLAVFLALFIWPGTKGPNRFGPVPRV